MPDPGVEGVEGEGPAALSGAADPCRIECRHSVTSVKKAPSAVMPGVRPEHSESVNFSRDGPIQPERANGYRLPFRPLHPVTTLDSDASILA